MTNKPEPIENTQQTDACPECGFSLYNPISRLSDSDIGLYSDERFPGRCIVSMHEHFDHLEDVPPDSVFAFFMNVRMASTAIRRATGCDRVNVAVLGNTESHVHAHLVPRYPAREALPHKSPWNDPRPHKELPSEGVDLLVERISTELDKLRPHRSAAHDEESRHF